MDRRPGASSTGARSGWGQAQKSAPLNSVYFVINLAPWLIHFIFLASIKKLPITSIFVNFN